MLLGSGRVTGTLLPASVPRIEGDMAKAQKKTAIKKKSRVVPPPKSSHRNSRESTLSAKLPDNVLSSLQNDALQSPSRKKKRHYHFKSEESRERCLSKLKPIKPGQVLNPGGRPRLKPFHQAAKQIADCNLEDLEISPYDNVATAIMKMHAVRALSSSQQAVPSAKELADRCEGPPVQVQDQEEGETLVLNKQVEEILVRFGVQLSIKQQQPQRNT